MTHNEQPIEGYHSGDTLRITVNVEDEDGNAVDIRNADIRFEIHQDESSGAVVVSKDNVGGGGVTITDGLNGTLKIEIEPSDTAALSGRFPYEIEITDTSSDVATVVTGTISINDDLIE
jgi:hypothetical protein